MKPSRLLVVANPGASRVGAGLGPALTTLLAAGIDTDLRHSNSREHLCALIRDADAAVDGIVIGGGDGTINSALPALIEAGKPIGILPLGTANDLARTLAISPDPVSAARTIAGGRRKRIDVGRVNDVHFANVASIGLSVAIADAQDPELKKQLGTLSYVSAVLKTIGRTEPFSATITCDGHDETVRALQIAVGSGVHYGGGLKIAPDAAVDDGMFDVYAIGTAPIPDLVALAPGFLDGDFGVRDNVRTFRAAAVRIDTETPMAVNTDGELITETPAVFSISAGALEVFTGR
ncbi:lipid kinase [Bauldia sp.]|uniref:lipid kinase n=1 Tax=Bauldia sp. TaxID=2575872 RepID=UPI003BAB74CA